MDLMTRLKQVAHYCDRHDEYCHNCMYDTKEFGCIWMSITKLVQNQCPNDWEFDEIERRLNATNS